MAPVHDAMKVVKELVEKNVFRLQIENKAEIGTRIYKFLIAMNEACGRDKGEKSVLLPGIFPPPFDSKVVGGKAHHKFESPEVKKFFLDETVGTALDDLMAVSHAICQMHVEADMEIFPPCSGSSTRLCYLFGEFVVVYDVILHCRFLSVYTGTNSCYRFAI